MPITGEGWYGGNVPGNPIIGIGAEDIGSELNDLSFGAQQFRTLEETLLGNKFRRAHHNGTESYDVSLDMSGFSYDLMFNYRGVTAILSTDEGTGFRVLFEGSHFIVNNEQDQIFNGIDLNENELLDTDQQILGLFQKAYDNYTIHRLENQTEKYGYRKKGCQIKDSEHRSKLLIKHRIGQLRNRSYLHSNDRAQDIGYILEPIFENLKQAIDGIHDAYIMPK